MIRQEGPLGRELLADDPSVVSSGVVSHSGQRYVRSKCVFLLKKAMVGQLDVEPFEEDGQVTIARVPLKTYPQNPWRFRIWKASQVGEMKGVGLGALDRSLRRFSHERDPIEHRRAQEAHGDMHEVGAYPP